MKNQSCQDRGTPAPSSSDLSTPKSSISSLMKPPSNLSRSSSNRSISVDGKAGYDRAHLCDEVLAAHFSAASQGLRLEAIEEKASKADIEMSKARAELAATEAQEAMQCVMWKNMFEAEINSAKIFREKAEHAEVRLKASTSQASQAHTEQLEVERLRVEVVDRGAGWANERERLLDEIYELQACLASHEGRVAGFELQVQKSSEAAAQATVMRCNELEALAQVRQEASRATARAEALEASRMSAEKQRNQAVSLLEAMKTELDMTSKNEETAVALALAEARSEAVIAREAKTKVTEIEIEIAENETAERVRALENERRKDVEEATRMHADAQQALELLCSFVQQRESSLKDGVSSNDMNALKEFEARIMAQSEAASTQETVAAAEAKAEATVALSAQKYCNELRSELVAQSRAQRDLHNELQALSNAAAAVRAVAAAKDETISELQATSRLMVSELAMGGSPQAHQRKVIDGKEGPMELSRESEGSTGDGPSVTPPSVTPSDAMSQASTLTVNAVGHYRTAANAQEGPTHMAWERSNASLVERVRSGSPPKQQVEIKPITHSRTPARALPKPFATPNRQHSQTPHSQQQHEETQLSQAAAFLNAAAAKAAAAASAVEAFFPFVPQTTPPVTTTHDESTPTSSAVGSDVPAIGSDVPDGSKTASSCKVDTGRTSLESGRAPPTGSKSWEEAQAVMTQQIRKDISLLRKALTETGMRGSALDDEVQALERQTETNLGLQLQKDLDTSIDRSRSTAASEKRVPQAIKDTSQSRKNIANLRRLSPSQGGSSKFPSANLAATLAASGGSVTVATRSKLGSTSPLVPGGSLRVGTRSPDRSHNSGSMVLPQGKEPGESVRINATEVMVSTACASPSASYVAPVLQRQASCEGVKLSAVQRQSSCDGFKPSRSVDGMRFTSAERQHSSADLHPFIRMPVSEVRPSVVTKAHSRSTSAVNDQESGGKMARDSSQVSVGGRREGGLMTSQSEVTLGQYPRLAFTAINSTATPGPPRGTSNYMDVSGGRFPARSGSPPVNRQGWMPVRAGSPPAANNVSRMVSIPTRCGSPPSNSVSRSRSNASNVICGSATTPSMGSGQP